MVSNQDSGKTVRYWKNGWRSGVLIKVEGKTAEVQHSVLKKIQKIHVEDCEIYSGGVRMATVFDSLFKAAQTVKFDKQKIDQSDDQYLTSLVRAIATISDSEWRALPLPAREWYDKAAVNVNTNQPPRRENPLLGFTGKGDIEELREVKEPPKGLTASEALSTSRASRFQASTSNPTAFPKERGKKGKGYMDAIRRTVIIHPEWTSRQVYDYLRLNGHPDAKLDTISVDGGNIRRVIEIAKELGLWINPKKEENGQAPTTGSAA